LDVNENSGGDAKHPISLWKLDKLMQGELPEAEAAALMASVSDSPEAMRYLERYSGMRSASSWEKFRESSAGTGSRHSPSAPRDNLSWMHRLFPGAGGRGFAMAMACLVAVGIGTWTWHQSGAPRPGWHGSDAGDPGFRSKGAEAIRVRLIVQGAEVEAGEIASAKPGDTLGISYRSPTPVSAQIWYREEGGQAAPMTGKPGVLRWDPSTAFTRAQVRIILDGDWKRQTVWVIASPSDFSEAEALQAMDGKSIRPDLRADAFRLAR
jgi:hypothetical protein